MIYDVSSPQFQQFLRTARRREDYAKAKAQGTNKTLISKPGGASSTGL